MTLKDDDILIVTPKSASRLQVQRVRLEGLADRTPADEAWVRKAAMELAELICADAGAKPVISRQDGITIVRGSGLCKGCADFTIRCAKSCPGVTSGRLKQLANDPALYRNYMQGSGHMFERLKPSVAV
ncbi:MAG: hypothetical protein LBT92_03555, partial [Rickettsiales bacterium]|nr:hypothetical protein [Rickettsiales bacterium]